MLQLLLLILKIIGITLAVIVGLLLTVLLLILFVPVRYRAHLTYNGDFSARGRIYWLLGFVSVRLTFADNKLVQDIRILGIRIFADKPGEGSAEADRGDTATDMDDTAGDFMEDSFYDISVEEEFDEVQMQKSMGTEDTAPKPDVQDQGISPTEGTAEEMKESPGEKAEEFADSQAEEAEEDAPPEEKMSFFARLKLGIQRFIRRVRHKIRNIQETVERLIKKKNLILDFWHDEKNKAAISFAWGEIKALFKHILPRRVTGRLAFGTGDPCSTGKILGVLGILYGKCRGAFVVEPDFLDKRLEGEVDIRGRIRMWTLVVIAVRVLLNRNLRYLRNSAMALKESVTA